MSSLVTSFIGTGVMGRNMAGHGGVVLGSECTGGIRNVFVENCGMGSPELDRITSAANPRVLFIRNGSDTPELAPAWFGCGSVLARDSRDQGRSHKTRSERSWSNAPGLAPGIFTRGFAGAVIDDISFVNSTFHGVSETEVVQHAGTIIFRNVTVIPAKTGASRNSVPAPKQARSTPNSGNA